MLHAATINCNVMQVGHLEMFLVMGTTTVTVAVNLNYAVLSFTLLFHLLKRKYGDRVRDLSSEESKHAASQSGQMED